MPSYPLEAHTRAQINMRLHNLGWVLDEKSPDCNVYQEHAKTEEQTRKFGGTRPDYVLYEAGTDNAIAIIEAKKPGINLDGAITQASRYAAAISAPLVFAFNDTFVIAKQLEQNRPLKIDGEEVQDFIDQLTSLRFIREGAEILSAPKGVNFTREELLDIFKATNKLLRKEGLRDGYERFSAFSEVLFLKLIDESERLNEHAGRGRTIDPRYTWSSFTEQYHGQALFDFVSDSVWKQMQQKYGDIFSAPLGIMAPSTLEEVIEKIDPINFTSTDTDVKGDAFEYFLKSVTNGNKDLGEYFTPRHIVRTMVNFIKPVYGEKIYDPFCGTGGFLLEAFKYLSLRADTTNDEIMNKLREHSLYGREITSTARIAKMNMILFGDGHSNIQQLDTFKHPVSEQYDVVLTNIPYSQETEYGSYYPIPTKNADSVSLQHVWQALKPGGRAAVVVPESFLYEGGVIGQTREMIAREAKELSIVSLPRGVFMPYTPTKTNVIYFKKGGQFSKSYHFVIFNDGFELSTRRKPLKGSSDLKKFLSDYEEQTVVKGQANVVSRDEMERSGSWNMRPFYYMEDIPEIKSELIYLDDTILQEVTDKVDPTKSPDESFRLLQVSQNGIFLSDVFMGNEATQAYKVVKAGDIVYNPYRVNIGSIGVVPKFLDGSLVSPAYVVLRAINDQYPPSYIVSILKHPRFMRVIMNYSLGSARASLPFSELTRIKVPKPTTEQVVNLVKLDEQLQERLAETDKLRKEVAEYTETHFKANGISPDHEADFDDVVTRVARGYGADGQTSKPK
jgi:type I restriction enzyme M protein